MTIWLTGCTAGLGKSLVSQFVAAEHTVIGGGRNVTVLSELDEEFPESHFFKLDVANEDSVIAFATAAHEAAGSPHLLINNASIINPPAPLWKISAADFDQLTAINISGVANMIRHTVPLMIESPAGMIVNLSSGWGRSTSPEVAPYCASKWAIEGLTQALAQELPEGLATVALNPGIINTDMLKTAFGSEASSFPSPEEWAKTAAPFLTSLTIDQNGQSLTAP